MLPYHAINWREYLKTPYDPRNTWDVDFYALEDHHIKSTRALLKDILSLAKKLGIEHRYEGYKWIKVKKFGYDNTLSIEKNYRILCDHHKEEVRFLIEEIKKLTKDDIIQHQQYYDWLYWMSVSRIFIFVSLVLIFCCGFIDCYYNYNFPGMIFTGIAVLVNFWIAYNLYSIFRINKKIVKELIKGG